MYTYKLVNKVKVGAIWSASKVVHKGLQCVHPHTAKRIKPAKSYVWNMNVSSSHCSISQHKGTDTRAASSVDPALSSYHRLLHPQRYINNSGAQWIHTLHTLYTTPHGLPLLVHEEVQPQRLSIICYPRVVRSAQSNNLFIRHVIKLCTQPASVVDHSLHLQPFKAHCKCKLGWLAPYTGIEAEQAATARNTFLKAGYV